MSRRRLPAPGATVVLLAALACTPRLAEPTATPGSLVPTTVAVRWSTPEAGQSWVTFGVEDPAERRAEAAVAAARDHEVRLVGLKPGRTYRYEAFTEIDGRVRSSGIHELTTPAAPPGLPTFELGISEPSATLADQFVATTVIEGLEGDGGWAIVLDGDGEPVWWFDTGHAGAVPADLADFATAWSGRSLPLANVYDPSSRSLVFSAYDLGQDFDVAVLRRVPIDALSADEVVTTRLRNGHHDFVLHEDGAVGFLGYEYDTIDDVRWVSDAVLETTEGSLSGAGNSRVWSWLQDGPSEPYLFAEAQELFPQPGVVEWTHSNSLMYVEEARAYFVMSKFLDCIVKVDRDTGRAEWILGGPFSDFTLPSGDPVWEGLTESRLWSHAHMSQLWYDPAAGTGGFAVFDNGSHRAERVAGNDQWSRLALYSFDEASRTVSETWSYVPERGVYTNLLGDVDELPSGHVLASWSNLGRGIEELAPSGEVLWRARPVARGFITGRAQALPGLPPVASSAPASSF